MFDFCRNPFAFRVAAVKTSGSLQGQAAADLDDVVGDNAKANPALHAFEPSISAAIQFVSLLQHANAPFACGPTALSSSQFARLGI